MCHDDFLWDGVWVAWATANKIELDDSAKLEIQERRAKYAADVVQRASERKILVAQRRAEREVKKAPETEVKQKEMTEKRAAAAIERAQKKEASMAAVQREKTRVLSWRNRPSCRPSANESSSRPSWCWRPRRLASRTSMTVWRSPSSARPRRRTA
jgi:hypothetical protein